MSPIKEESKFKQFILKWNAKYPFDRILRKRHGIVFGSMEHKETIPYFLCMDMVEDNIMGKFVKDHYAEQKGIEEYKKNNVFLKDGATTKQLEEDFENMLGSLRKVKVADNG